MKPFLADDEDEACVWRFLLLTTKVTTGNLLLESTRYDDCVCIYIL